MSYNPNNPFAKILRGELPCYKIYEDAHTLAFMDIMPQADGHCLVIPKEAAVTIMELSPESMAALAVSLRRVARGAQQAMGSEGVLIFQLNGAAAGQTVPHVHFHVVPGGHVGGMRPHAQRGEAAGKLEALAQKIGAAIASDI